MGAFEFPKEDVVAKLEQHWKVEIYSLMTLNTLEPLDHPVNEEMVEILLKHCHNGHYQGDLMFIESTNSEPICHPTFVHRILSS